jgi:hypothetical protein
MPHLRASLQLPGLTQPPLMLVGRLALTPPKLAELARALVFFLLAVASAGRARPHAAAEGRTRPRNAICPPVPVPVTVCPYHHLHATVCHRATNGSPVPIFFPLSWALLVSHSQMLVTLANRNPSFFALICFTHGSRPEPWPTYQRCFSCSVCLQIYGSARLISGPPRDGGAATGTPAIEWRARGRRPPPTGRVVQALSLCP